MKRVRRSTAAGNRGLQNGAISAKEVSLARSLSSSKQKRMGDRRTGSLDLDSAGQWCGVGSKTDWLIPCSGRNRPLFTGRTSAAFYSAEEMKRCRGASVMTAVTLSPFRSEGDFLM